ncbi:MAG: glycosyltransferase family 4 protein, partial [Bacteroidota bacterium]
LWITLTKSMKEEVLKFTRMPREKVDVVPLGVDLTRFDPSRYKRSEARAFFGLPQKGFLIGVLGRLDRQKGQEVLLRSVSEVVERHPDAHFIIAGDETVGEPRSGNPGYKAHLENLCRTLSIERHVTFMPFIDDVPRFMAALDLVVLPSFAETYGLVVIEAMAMEKPVIATNAGGVPEIITDGKTGLLVEPRDSKALSRAILRVLDDAELGKSLARSARTEALRSYDENACVDQLLRLIAAVC